VVADEEPVVPGRPWPTICNMNILRRVIKPSSFDIREHTISPLLLFRPINRRITSADFSARGESIAVIGLYSREC
jgi:hypothetical protein